MSTAGDLVAGEIEEHMARQGISPSRLARRAGMPRMTLWRRMADPDQFTLPEIERVARALGTTPWALCGVYVD